VLRLHKRLLSIAIVSSILVTTALAETTNQSDKANNITCIKFLGALTSDLLHIPELLDKYISVFLTQIFFHS
jgi:hypothetical protein